MSFLSFLMRILLSHMLQKSVLKQLVSSSQCDGQFEFLPWDHLNNIFLSLCLAVGVLYPLSDWYLLLSSVMHCCQLTESWISRAPSTGLYTKWNHSKLDNLMYENQLSSNLRGSPSGPPWTLSASAIGWSSLSKASSRVEWALLKGVTLSS